DEALALVPLARGHPKLTYEYLLRNRLALLRAAPETGAPPREPRQRNYPYAGSLSVPWSSFERVGAPLAEKLHAYGREGTLFASLRENGELWLWDAATQRVARRFAFAPPP